LEGGDNNPAVLFSITAPFDQNPFEAFTNLGGAIAHALKGDLYNLPDVTHSYPRFRNEPNEAIGIPTTTTQVSPKTESGIHAPPWMESRLEERRGAGQSLPYPTRSFMERSMGTDFSQVKIHTDSQAVQLNKDLGAHAFTTGNDIFFNEGKWNPDSDSGKHLLAHELTHIIQQKPQNQVVQRNGYSSPGPRGDVQVRLPIVDEALTQISDLHGALEGRSLSRQERKNAERIFKNSIDYSRVRIIETRIAAGTTVGNNIRLPVGFNVDTQEGAQLLIHELTHVWQYQHHGSGYVTTSLLQQAHAALTLGNRNFAYDYTISPGDE